MRRILIAYDGSGPARRALEAGAELAKASGAAVGIVGVTEEDPFLPADDPWGPASDRAEELAEAKRRLAELGVEAAVHQQAGVAGPQIVAVAAEHGYDTIVVGSRGLGALGRALLGSVSEYVAHHSPVNVFVIR